MAKTLGQVAREKWGRELVNNNASPSQSWQAVADAVVAAHEARRWRPIAEAKRDGTVFLVKGGVAHFYNGVLCSLTAEPYPGRPITWDCRVFCELPAPPQEVERGA